jgi:hypothetical protein
VAESDFDYRLRTQWESATLLGMESSTHRKPQPGWTGTRALRIVQATLRTVLSVDPIGRRSAVATSRSAFVSSWGTMLRLSPPVSVTPCGMETGGAKLAQRQCPRGFEPNDLRCKSPEIRFRAARSTRSRPQTLDPRTMSHRSSRGVIRKSECLSMSCPAVKNRQPRSRATTTQRGRRSDRLNTYRSQDRTRTDTTARDSMTTERGQAS